MNSDDFRERGEKMLRTAHDILTECDRALQKSNWNLTVRRAQDACELLIKAGVLKLGFSHVKGHFDQAAKQFIELLKTNRVKILEFHTDDEVPKAIIMHHTDSNSSGCQLQYHKHQFQFFRMLDAQLIPQWKSEIEGKHKITVYHDTENGGVVFLVSNQQLIVAFNENGGQFLFHEKVFEPDYLSPEEQVEIISAAKRIGLQRESSFYHERDFSKAEASDTIHDLMKVYCIVKSVFRGPIFGWDLFWKFKEYRDANP